MSILNRHCVNTDHYIDGRSIVSNNNNTLIIFHSILFLSFLHCIFIALSIQLSPLPHLLPPIRSLSVSRRLLTCMPWRSCWSGWFKCLSVPIPIKTNKQNQSKYKVISLPLSFSFLSSFSFIRLYANILGTSGQVRVVLWTSKL